MSGDTTVRGGVDAKAVIKDALTLDMTFNPDFSQVESDEPQVTVNQRYEVFFPEKRPFFMENASYFLLPQQLFFSRRIIDPQFGVRLTGKLGRWAIGVLAADDRAPGRRAAAGSALDGKRATDAVLSVQRDFLKDSHVRLFVTDRELAASSNRVASLDMRLRLPGSWFITAPGGHQPVQSARWRTPGRQFALHRADALRAQLHIQDQLYRLRPPVSAPTSATSSGSTSGS